MIHVFVGLKEGWERMGLDYYSILGVEEHAPEDEIKKKYRELAKKYHPDGNPGDQEAEKRFKEAGEAYGVLGDKEKRCAYDRERAGLKTDGGGGKKKAGPVCSGSRPMAGFDFNHMSDGFEQFFGFHPKSGQVNEDKLKHNKKTKTDPIDMTEMFERYMGMKK